jgi:hypothetical protein
MVMEYQDMKNIFQNLMFIAYKHSANLDQTKYVHYPIFLQLPPSNILTIKLIPKSWFITCINHLQLHLDHPSLCIFQSQLIL